MQPIILIGAARSGTKLLRDVIAQHPEASSIPYDVNYLWRMGNETLQHDELLPTHLTNDIVQDIQSGLLSSVRASTVLIEKTVSNCLRVPYVHTIFPNAKYIHLLRDGRDVVESVYRQWTAKPDWRYILKKAQNYPITKAPGYAMQYAFGTFRRALSPTTAKPHTWGPRYRGIDEDLAAKGVLEVCAIQWAQSVSKALEGFRQIGSVPVLTIRYEDFVTTPLAHLEQIAAFIGVDPTPYYRVPFDTISIGNIGKGLRNLDRMQQQVVMEIIDETLTLAQEQQTTY